MDLLTRRYESAKTDILMSFEIPLRESDRITGDWIYSVDPETMDFVKIIYKHLGGNYSLYTTFIEVGRSKDINALLSNKA